MPNQNIITLKESNSPKGRKSEIVSQFLDVEEILKHMREPGSARTLGLEPMAAILIDTAISRLQAAFDAFDKDPDTGPFEV